MRAAAGASNASGDCRRRPAARLRDARGDAAPRAAGAARSRLQRPSLGISNRDAGECRRDRHRRLPEAHGLLGNTVYVPTVNATRGLDTGSRANLEAIARSDGRLLTAPVARRDSSAGAAGRCWRSAPASSGAALLLNHTVGSGAILHHEYTLPAGACRARPREARPSTGARDAQCGAEPPRG